LQAALVLPVVGTLFLGVWPATVLSFAQSASSFVK